MFDVGFAELFLLSLIGLLVLGPERLPAVARTLGGFVRKARVSYHNLKRTVEAELQAAEAADSLKQAKQELESVQQEVKALGDKLSEDQTAGLTPTAADPDPAEPTIGQPAESESESESESATPETAPAEASDAAPRPPFSSEPPGTGEASSAAGATNAEPEAEEKNPPAIAPVEAGTTETDKTP